MPQMSIHGPNKYEASYPFFQGPPFSLSNQ
jgi:hypothetical protein